MSAQVSYTSTAVSLSDKTEFPSFLRTISSDQSWAQRVALLLSYFNWTWVGIVTQDDDFGIQGSSLLITELEKMGACKEFLITIPTSKSWENIEYNKELLRASTAKVIVMFLISLSVPCTYERVSLSDIRGKIWIRSSVQENEVKLSNYKENMFIKTFWEENFGCKWPSQDLDLQRNSTDTGEDMWKGQRCPTLAGKTITCTPNWIFIDKNASWYRIIDLSHAALVDIPQTSSFITSGMCIFRPRRGRKYPSMSTETFLNDILNWQETPNVSFYSVKIGYIDPMAPKDKELMINKSTIIWMRGAAQALKQLCGLEKQLSLANLAHCQTNVELNVFGFGIVFTVAISSVLAKIITVVLAFRAKKPGTTICGIWVGTSPPFLNKDSHSEPGFIVIECNKGSITAYYCVLGYMGFLALVSFIVACLARSLPDSFSEAKFITFSMLVFCGVWISFLPTYHSSNGRAKVTVEIFSILASSAALFTFIFILKCCLILLRPEKNVQGYLKKR
ncbi:hypothetical protein HPG69_002884 [Diceros bicornis minor]|uniref:G-protein coupled receptors family 3 profile domain-containing protein n=1 Tax=Diceros bicornis minor TaxID=77932 RepID=A0A7J7ER20_DICBM|nr:hypothetical protein HPG69_002884 [Diceros bicornis minor]